MEEKVFDLKILNLKKAHLGKAVLWGVLALLAAAALYPVFFLVSGSFMGKDELGDCLGAVVSGKEGYADFPLLPGFPTLSHYVEVFLDSPEFFVMFWNSIKITFGVLAGQLAVGTGAAWGFAKYEFPWKRGFFLIYMILMLLPFQVLMLSDYLILDRLALIDHLWGIILPGIFSTFPVFIMYRFFSEIPDSLLESARLDGAREWQLFLYLALPIGSSGIIAAMVLGFLEYWSLIEQPLTFLKEKKPAAFISISAGYYLRESVGHGLCGVSGYIFSGADGIFRRAGLSGTGNYGRSSKRVSNWKGTDGWTGKK